MDTPIVISYFLEHAPVSLDNHRRYAAALGYRHDFVDGSSGPRGAQAQTLRKYEILLEALSHAPSDTLVLLLGEDVAIVEPVPLHTLMAGRQHLLARTGSLHPAVNVQIWRNTPASRADVYKILTCCRFGGPSFNGDGQLLSALETTDWHALINGVCPVMQTGANVDPAWRRVPTFAITIDGDCHAPDKLGKVPRFRDALIGHLNQCRADGVSLFSSLERPENDEPERSSYNPGRRIAFATLYTPEIASYGRIAEQNFRRYCDIHGYSLYVHRDHPKEVGLSGTANWLKPWLLHAYLQHHEWVFWLDADVLFADEARSIESLLTGRDLLLARDIGQWPFNSGVMGFRDTARNEALLRKLMDSIASLHDRSTVYSSNGDQYYFIEALKAAGLLCEDEILSPLVINTPWFFDATNSFLVHYYGMWPEMRALMMAHDESNRHGRCKDPRRTVVSS
ncbi:galactosyl transferase GMA12/MNN10 domain protein [Paraburkholderia domus]|uniref:Galactosyl transferase GMA12/MNN10 domain protein n=1 Tax=Paraburkholderia domus TaxID=2793075 RepID=A0A9N8N7T0_9BURK|nr:galactosyl transferase GMA12/MNN10 domain protein [Paraburkholderia domus]MBK5169407.1 galactosyl transferase GMA12/MNN10 domain protein [Burkholderia sp. R-70211]CAE6935815.1 hypothetical protein R70211_05384 [Paraburkholderia domus]